MNRTAPTNTASRSALGGLRVLEISRDIAAACCGKLLAGFGAEVVRLAPPDARTDQELLSGWYHTGKRCAPWDPADAREQLAALAATADLIIEDLGPGGLEALGGDNVVVGEDAVVLRISPFGASGPYRHYAADDITLYAASGLMQSTGRGDIAPLNAGFALAQVSAGLRAYCAALMALTRRARNGGGGRIDLSLHEAAMDNYEVALVEYLHTGKVARRNGDEHNMVPWRTLPCRDGWAAIIGGPIRHWLGAAKMFGDSELLSERLAHMAGRMQNRQEVYDRLAPWLMAHDKQEIFHIGQKHGLAWTPLVTLSDALADPQHAARGFFVEAPAPHGGTVRQPGAPFRGPELVWRASPPQPLSGDSGSEWWGGGAQAGSTPPATTLTPDPSPASGRGESAPLAGIRVIDFTHDWAGPHAARLLADYGAEVIKVEYPGRLDGMRGAYAERFDAHPRFHQLHRNKASVTLDLHDPAQHAACLRLIAEADVVLDNSRPGVMARFGLDREALAADHPRLIGVSLSAFGASGPYRDYAGYGGSIEAISGLQDLTAYEPDGERFRVREMDVLNGVFGACAILTALEQRRRTGRGQWIDVSETETCAWLIGEHYARASREGDPLPTGNRHAQHAPQGCYACAGDDRWLTLSVRGDDEFQALARAIGRDQWCDDAGLQDAPGRHARHDELDTAIAAWCAGQDAFAAEQRLQAAGVPAAVVRNARDLADDPHLAARGWWLEAGGNRYPGLPFHFAGGGGVLRRAGPDLGADNAQWLPRLGLEQGQWPPLDAGRLGTAYDMTP